MTRTYFSLAAATAALALTSAQPTAAQALHLYNGYSTDPTKVVTYTRLEVSRADAQTSRGAHVILQRIETAADAVCGGHVYAQTYPANYETCRKDAMDAAVRKVATPAIEAVVAERRTEPRYATN